MYSTYHFKNVDELDAAVIDAIKMAYKGKSIIISVSESATMEEHEEVPDWQQNIVAERLAYYKQHPEELSDWNAAKDNLRID